jgi:hypothetical protein
MKIIPVAISVALALVPALARADGSAVTIVTSQFCDHVDHGKPVGDAKSISDAHKAIYWLDMANGGDATQVTLVWKVEGKEIQRQSLDVGQSPHWHTWGGRPLASGASGKIDVEVLDAAGNSLKQDSISL